LNAGKSLPGCAAALVEGVSAGLIREVIFTDGGSTDDTAEIAEEVGAKFITGPPSRGGQLRRGCAAARGTWLLILHADTQLGLGWSDAAHDHIATGMAGYGDLRFDKGGRLVSRGANLRSRLFGLPYGDQGLLLPLSLYNDVGGYADQPLMEDVALARALRGRLIPAGFTAVTSGHKYRQHGWVRQALRNLWTLMRYKMGVPAERLAQSYNRSA